MSVKDWYGGNKAWKLSLPTVEVAPLMAATSGPDKNIFKLKPTKKKHKVVYFTVDYKRNALPAAWKKVKLFPRGNPLAPQPASELPAQPNSMELVAAIGAVRNHLNDRSCSTERLEGDIDVSSQRASLTLVQIPKAVNGDEALLCVFLAFDANPPGGASNPDGTGGGSSVHP